jgi:hypothetical protein
VALGLEVVVRAACTMDYFFYVGCCVVEAVSVSDVISSRLESLNNNERGILLWVDARFAVE